MFACKETQKLKGVNVKTAVIYFSYEGNCALVAESIKAALNADVFEIKIRDGKKRTGFAKYFWGCLEVMTNKKPELLPLSIDINAFDLIILGTPVWAGSPTPAMVSFLSKTGIAGKKIALFCCHAGGKGKVFNKLKAMLPGNTIAGEIDFDKAAKEESAGLKQKISEWAKTLGA
jgi:flavodoxin